MTDYPTDMALGDMLECSFCGSKQDQVELIISGHEAWICNRCVKLCNQIVEKRDQEDDKVLIEALDEMSRILNWTQRKIGEARRKARRRW